MKLVSVIIVNYNGAKWLKECLSSIFSQDYKRFEVILVDNGSTDNSVSYVRKHYPKTAIVKSKDNAGFAGGNNIGYKKSKGDYILLLNNDTKIPKDFISKLVNGLSTLKEADILQPKIVLMKDKKRLDTAGSFWTNTTFLYHYGFGKDSGLKKYNKPYPVFSVKGAAVIIKREVIDKIGLFDDDFWSYYEETDFCHRAWIDGFQSWYWPEVTCYHAMGGTSKSIFRNDYDLIQFHNFKNKLLSFLKNLEIKNLVLYLPVYAITTLMVSAVWIIRLKPRYAFAIYKSWYWNIRNINSTLKKRKNVQKLRKKSDHEVFKQTMKNPQSVSYYYYLLRDKMSQYED